MLHNSAQFCWIFIFEALAFIPYPSPNLLTYLISMHWICQHLPWTRWFPLLELYFPPLLLVRISLSLFTQPQTKWISVLTATILLLTTWYWSQLAYYLFLLDYEYLGEKGSLSYLWGRCLNINTSLSQWLIHSLNNYWFILCSRPCISAK